MNIFSLVRIHNLVITILAFLIIHYILDYQFSFLSFICITIIISCMASGYIVNDMLDTQNDYVNKKNNQIMKKQITLIEARNINLFCISLYVFCSFYINFYSLFVL